MTLTTILIALSLTPQQITLFALLYDRGPQTARELSKLSGITRSYIYKLCDQLISQGLVKRLELDRKIHFQPSPPEAIHTLIQQKQSQLALASTQLGHLLPSLVSSYSLIENNIQTEYIDIHLVPKNTTTQTLTTAYSGLKLTIYDDVVLLGHLKLTNRILANWFRALFPKLL